eukprot:m.61583 g.61583  ORF g.61583 m.61583 type:complete len:318 (-) comp8035_c0_seq2:596-1549(-)
MRVHLPHTLSLSLSLSHTASVPEVVLRATGSCIPLLKIIAQHFKVRVAGNNTLGQESQQLDGMFAQHALPFLFNHALAHVFTVALVRQSAFLLLTLVGNARPSVLNQLFNRALVFQGLHATALCRELFQTVIVCKFLHHGPTEFFLLGSFFRLSARHKGEVRLAIALQFGAHAVTLGFIGPSALFHSNPHLLLVEFLPHAIHLLGFLTLSGCFRSHLGLNGFQDGAFARFGGLDRLLARLCLTGLPFNFLVLALHLLTHGPLVCLSLLLKGFDLCTCHLLALLFTSGCLIVFLLDLHDNLVNHRLVLEESFIVFTTT